MERRRLATARYEKGWSQEELAERVGVTRNTLSKWERGIVAPYPLHVHRLCSLFGKTAAELDLEKTSRKSQQKAVKEVAQNTPAVPSVSSITLEKSASPVPVILDSPFLQSVEPETQRWFRPADHDMLLSIQTERVSLDLEEPTAWFGRKLAYLLTIVEECCGHQELQQKMGNVLNSMQPKANDTRFRGDSCSSPSRHCLQFCFLRCCKDGFQLGELSSSSHAVQPAWQLVGIL